MDAHVACGIAFIMVSFNYIWGAVCSWLVSTFICIYIYIYILSNLVHCTNFGILVILLGRDHSLYHLWFIGTSTQKFFCLVMRYAKSPCDIFLCSNFLGTCSFLNLDWMYRCVFCLCVICLLYCSSFHKWTCGDVFACLNCY